MRRIILVMLTATCLIAARSSDAPAQTRGRTIAPPLISSVSPPGAKVGSTVEWTLTGRGFPKAKRVLVSGGGVELLEFTPKGENLAVANVRVDEKAEPGYRELRVEGPDGISNLVLVRLDTLVQVIESEPNDDPRTAQRITLGTAVAGVLRPQDVDHYRVEGPPGKVVTVDLEARRVGTSITPVLTILNGRGSSIAQARESRSADHDPRLAVKIPADGVFFVQVRDNTYGGNDTATYRVRLTTSRFATGLFPLGGPRGKPLTLTASGGSLSGPLSKTITLPDTPGAIVDPGAFEGADGPVMAPGKVVVGDDREIAEAPPDPKGVSTTPITLGQTANGRIDRRNEVDRYSISVKKGEKFRIKIEAEPLGSWLDSVVTVRKADGESLAENDDGQANPNAQRGVNVFGLSEISADSQLDFEATADGPLLIEVADRYGDGGPEYGYRLSVGATRADFAINVLIGNPNANGQLVNAARNQALRGTPGLFGVYNLAPGTKTQMNFLVTSQGRPGPVTVRVEGLPDGVTAEPVKVEVLGPGKAGGQPEFLNAPAKAESVVLNVESYAGPGLAEIRVVATAEPEPGVKLTRTATAMIGLEAVPSPIPARPITRQIDRFPLRVVGDSSKARPAGPPAAPRLLTVRVPGVLLQGDRIDLGLEFDTSPLAEPGFDFEAKAKGIGLATNTVISSGSSMGDSEEAPPPDVLVRVLASPKVVPGVYPVTISYSLGGVKKMTSEVSVIVKPPLEILVRAEEIALKPGGSAAIWVALRREKGAEVDVDFKVEGLPRGVKVAEPVTLKEAESEAEIKLEMASTAKPLTKPTEIRIIAVARMPRGSVPVESKNRPMLAGVAAE
jgi:hypothetical protein